MIYLPLGVLLNDPSKTVGGMILSTFFIVLAVIYSGFASHFIVFRLYDYTFVLLAYFFISLFAYHILKAFYIKELGSAMDLATLFLIFSVITGYNNYHNDVFNAYTVIEQCRAYLISACLSFTCSVLIFPSWAGDEVRKNIKAGLKSLGELLSIIAEITWKLTTEIDEENEPTDFDFPEWRQKISERLQESIDQARSNFGKITVASNESKMEMSYSLFDPFYYDSFSLTVRRLLRHLTSMGSSCELLLRGTEKKRAAMLDFISRIEVDLMVFVELSMAELAFIYGKFQSSSTTDDDLQFFKHNRYFTNESHTDSVKPKTTALDLTSIWKKITRKGTNNEKIFQFFQSPYEQLASPINEVDSVGLKSDASVKSISPQTDDFPMTIKSTSTKAQKRQTMLIDFKSRVQSYIDPVRKSPTVASVHEENETETLNRNTLLEALYVLESHEDHVLLEHISTETKSPDTILKRDTKLELTTEIIKKGKKYSESDDMDDLFIVSSFMLCLSMFGEKLHDIGCKTRNLQKKRSLYVPFVWNDPRFRKNTYQNLSGSEEDALEENIHARKTSKTHNFNVWQKFKETEKNNIVTWSRAVKHLIKGSIQMAITKSFTLFETNQHRYAFRVALVVTFFSIFGFISETRDLYNEYKGNWALFTVGFVMSSTVGGSTVIGLWRIVGTITGGLYAILVWSLFPSLEHNVAHFLMTLIFAFPCLYLRLCTKYNRLGGVSIITFTVVFYGAYIQEIIYSRDPTTEPTGVYITGLRRTVMICLGTILSLIATITVFPVYAKHDLRIKFGQIISDLGLLYTKMLTKMVISPNSMDEIRLEDFLRLEFNIQLSIIDCKDLVLAASNELLMKDHQGQIKEFPGQEFTRGLDNCQKILDRLLSCRLASFIGFSDYFKTHVLEPLHEDRKALLGCLMLYFSIMYGALSSKMPIPSMLPDIQMLHQNLRQRLASIPHVYMNMLHHHDFQYMFISSSVQEIILDLIKIIEILKEIYGARTDTEFLEKALEFEKSL
jgi:hypothetical protein